MLRLPHFYTYDHVIKIFKRIKKVHEMQKHVEEFIKAEAFCIVT